MSEVPTTLPTVSENVSGGTDHNKWSNDANTQVFTRIWRRSHKQWCYDERDMKDWRAVQWNCTSCDVVDDNGFTAIV